MSAGGDKFRNRIKEMATRKLLWTSHKFSQAVFNIFQGPSQISGFFRGFFRGIYHFRGISRVAGHHVHCFTSVMVVLEKKKKCVV